MPRKSNDDLKDMTLRQLNAYSDTNPAEGLRISKACYETQKYAANNYWNYHKEKAFNAVFPGTNQLLETKD